MGRVACSDSWPGTGMLRRPLGSGLVLRLVVKAPLGVYSPLELFLLATDNQPHPPGHGTRCYSPQGFCTNWPLSWE